MKGMKRFALSSSAVDTNDSANHPDELWQDGVQDYLTHALSIMVELLIQAQLSCESATLTPALLCDFRHMLELSPHLLEELMKAVYSCTSSYFELHNCMITNTISLHRPSTFAQAAKLKRPAAAKKERANCEATFLFAPLVNDLMAQRPNKALVKVYELGRPWKWCSIFSSIDLLIKEIGTVSFSNIFIEANRMVDALAKAGVQREEFFISWW
ncbi:hypothetical protein REPUB_Repub18cG0064400 [Reevesia pubescens]